MNEFSSSIAKECKELINHKELIKQTLKRDFIMRYKGSSLGVAWAFLMPILLLAIYTFVFSIIFKAKWGTGAEHSKVDFALILFIGMIIYNFVSEVLTRSPQVILQNANFVKKVVYPLETIPFVVTLSAFFNMCISFLIWFAALICFKGDMHLTALYLPLIILPLLFGALGMSLFLSSLGAYIRDVSQITGVLATILMFLSPIFFSIETIPVQFRGFMQLNPLTYFIEESRNILFFGKSLDLRMNFISLIISLFVLKLGFSWFQKTRSGFSDVI